MSFKASECSCNACVENCRRPAHFLPNESRRVSKKMGLSHEQFLEKYIELQLVGKLRSKKLNSGSNIEREIYGETPRTSENGWCVFFDTETKRCGIHAVKPFGCRIPNHTTTVEEAKKIRNALARAWLKHFV